MQRKKNRKWMYWAGGGLVVLVIAAVLWANGRTNQAETASSEGEVITAFIGDLSASATASGQHLNSASRRESRT